MHGMNTKKMLKCMALLVQ